MSAQDDASARREVLPALSRCTVLVPTVAGAGDKLRFLPSASGGMSLPVFTGLDALEHAAKKHGWVQGTQSVSFRSISARDALEVAEMQRLRSVIVDAAAEHALELKDDDVSLYLSRGTGEFSPESLRPSRGTGDFGQPGAGTSRGTGDHGQPRKQDEPKSAVREEVAPRKARDARRDDDGSAPAERPSRGSSPGAPPKTRPPSQATPKRRDSSGSMRRKAKLAEIDDPFSSSPPRKARAKPDSGGQGRRVPSLNAPPLSKEMPSSPFESSAPPSTPESTKAAPAKGRALRDYSHIRDETIPLEDISTAEAARESAARIASLSDPAAPMEMFGRVDSLPVPPPQAAVPPQPAKPAPAPAADLPMVGFSDAPPPEPERVAPVVAAPAPEPAPKSLVKTLPPPAVRTAPPPAIISDPPPQSIAPAPIKAIEPERGTGTVAKPPPEVAATDAPGALSEAVLSAIADELRKFPEAEWACQLDDTDKNVIGVRVDPSYLERTKDIEASIIGAAKKAGAAIVPLIVSTPAATKDARSRGKMFFPWKKKK